MWPFLPQRLHPQQEDSPPVQRGDSWGHCHELFTLCLRQRCPLCRQPWADTTSCTRGEFEDTFLEDLIGDSAYDSEEIQEEQDDGWEEETHTMKEEQQACDVEEAITPSTPWALYRDPASLKLWWSNTLDESVWEWCTEAAEGGDDVQWQL